MAEDAVQDAVASSFDTDALATQVADKLRESFQSAPQRQYAPAPPPEPRNADPIADLVDPYVKPHVDRATRAAALSEEAATDAVDFYADHPELTKPERQEIEKRFKALRANGVPFKRDDIYKHYQGENLDAAVDRKIKSREDAARRASDNSTVGGGSPDKAPQARNAREMSTEELETAMDGVLF